MIPRFRHASTRGLDSTIGLYCGVSFDPIMWPNPDVRTLLKKDFGFRRSRGEEWRFSKKQKCPDISRPPVGGPLSADQHKPPQIWVNSGRGARIGVYLWKDSVPLFMAPLSILNRVSN